MVKRRNEMSIYKLSFKNLNRRKLRSALTMLGIVIGVTALVVLMGLGSGMTSYMKGQTESIMGDVSIMNSSAAAFMGSTGDSYINKEAVAKIKNMSQLYDIREETQFQTNIQRTPVIVVGMSDWKQIKINGTPGVVISKSPFVDNFGYKIGSKIKIKEEEFVITGITNEGGFGMGIVFLNTSLALPLNDNKVSSITASTKKDPEVVKKEIEAQVDGISALTKSDYAKQIDEIMSGITLFVGLIASIALLVGVISIVNIMLVNVSERTREIGVLKAIGFTNREILGSILMEAGLLGLIGSVAGLIIAALLLELGIIYLAPQLNMDGIKLVQMLPLWLVVGVIGGSAVLSVLAGLYPAWRASRLNVVEALRYE